MIELLSPAGNMDSLKAAIAGGCDAVYLGGTFFGARAFANNFNDSELVEAIKYAHLYGVKVYVTTNILIYEHEVEHFLKYVEFLHQNNVDAIIIQDLGMLDLVHKTFPNLEIHASTQMHIHNLDGAYMAKKLGVKRVVLARETSIEKVKVIREKTGVDVEIFAHGALCVSYSGQCLFSSLIGNRSGNRGSCVGSCRLSYQIINDSNKVLNSGDYPLSMKDLNTLEYVGELIEAGVTSLKIEGRMKSPEYVYTVTKLYREAIDSYYQNKKIIINEKEFHNLQTIFSRGYTKGYLFNEDMNKIINDNRPNHQGIKVGKVIDFRNNMVDIKLEDEISINDGLRILLKNEDYGLILNQFYRNRELVKSAKKGDVIRFKVNKKIPINSQVLLTKSEKLNKEINEIIKNNSRKIELTLMIKLKLGEQIKLVLDDNKNKVEIYGNIVEKALNNPLTKDDIAKKITKLGNTIYSVKNLEIEMSDNVFVPISEINNLKREAIELLNKKRLYKIAFLHDNYKRVVPNFINEKQKSILVSNISLNNVNNYDIVYSENINDNVITKIPKVMDNYQNFDVNKEYLVGELGAFNRLNNLYCDYSFNVTNSYTVALLHSLGAKRITLSYELSYKQIKNIIDAYKKRYHKHPNLEVVIYGKREVMALKTNLNKIYKDNKLFLRDRFGNKYPIREINNISYIYDYKTLDNRDDLYQIGVNTIRENSEIL